MLKWLLALIFVFNGGGGGMRATGGGVSKTPANTTLESLYYTVVQQYTT